jgi:hypothetical protein
MDVYVARKGLSYPGPDGKPVRVAVGDRMPDEAAGRPALPARSLPWLLEQGAIKAVPAPRKDPRKSEEG